MEEVVTVALLFFAEVIVYKVCYSVGWITLKILSFGRIRIETKRKKWNEKEWFDLDYYFSGIETAIFDFDPSVCRRR